MTLADLRKVTVKKNLKIRFQLSNGMECILNEQGIAQVPALRAAPSFNLEDELTRAQEFLVEQAGLTGKEKDKSTPRRYDREQLATFASAGAAADASHDDHDE